MYIIESYDSNVYSDELKYCNVLSGLEDFCLLKNVTNCVINMDNNDIFKQFLN